MIGILFPHKQLYSVIRHNTDTASALITYYISIPILPYPYTEKSLRHVAIVAKFVDLNQLWSCKYGGKKRYVFPVHHYTPKQNGSPYFPSVDKANGRLCQERLLRFGNFATVATLETRRELESKCFSQLFLGSLLMTRLSAIGLFFSCSL